MVTLALDICQLVRPECQNVFVHNCPEDYMENVDPDPIAPTLARNLFDEDEEHAPHDIRTQRSLCAKYFRVAAWILEVE